MKYIAILSVLILIVTLVGVGYMYMTANIIVAGVDVIAVEASSQLPLFEELREQLRLGAVVGTPYIAAQELSDAENYQFLTYTVRLQNDCSVPADMIELPAAILLASIIGSAIIEDLSG